MEGEGDDQSADGMAAETGDKAEELEDAEGWQ